MRYWALWALLIVAVGAFAMQVAARVRLIAAAPGHFSFDDFGLRFQRFLLDVVLQRRTIRERPVAGAAHALVFWGFTAFAGYTSIEFLYGLGIADLTASPLVSTPIGSDSRRLPPPFWRASSTCSSRRAFVRPAGLGDHVSIESVVIALFIATLMSHVPAGLPARREHRRGTRELVDAHARHPRVHGAHSGVEAPSSRAVANHRYS